MKKLFPYVIALSALSVSASAALYSVVGLSKLFAGAKIQVMIMAGSLEFAKLVIASVLYQYWEKTNAFIKAYLMIALIILITITSGGIYGYLSGAYQETSNQSEFMEKEVAIIDSKRVRFEEQRSDYQTSIKTWTEALANPTQIQYVDKESGQLVTTTSSRQRRTLESELKEAKINLSAVTDSISVLDMKILDMELNNEAARELGPLKYMAKLFDKSMDEIINWFMVMIIFVFDPLAIILVVIANQAFTPTTTTPTRKEKSFAVYGEDENPVAPSPVNNKIGYDKVMNDIAADDNLSIRQKMNLWNHKNKNN
tara:strand:+ start:1242 stop:2177 length:936 start_codon:yes stop_codon:yes gene_type:complete